LIFHKNDKYLAQLFEENKTLLHFLFKKKKRKKKINTLRSKVLAHISPFKHDCAANKTQNRDFMPPKPNTTVSQARPTLASTANLIKILS
jgi:primosomal protein N''